MEVTAALIAAAAAMAAVAATKATTASSQLQVQMKRLLPVLFTIAWPVTQAHDVSALRGERHI